MADKANPICLKGSVAVQAGQQECLVEDHLHWLYWCTSTAQLQPSCCPHKYSGAFENVVVP